MATDRLKIRTQPRLEDGRMVLAFSGWMDGGDVSTGAVHWLVRALEAQKVADIDSEGFYIYSFPGPMELAAMFRPYTKIDGGVIRAYQPPTNEFFCDENNELTLFSGKEPHSNWREFADCLFSFASQARVSTLYFIGSVAGATPHTREPRLMSTVSDESLKPALQPYGVNFTDYEGPASISTYLITEASNRGLHMASLVAEIPAYIQGTNPKGIEAVIRRLAAILRLQVRLDDLRATTEAWEKRVNAALVQEQDLATHIRKLEADYDNEVFDTQMGDLKEWLEQRGIRVD
ncbi:MAG: PAC2 family protein [Planctomycetota bacterium]|jgi:predicted ATP-grasp superfamily ATP-dependent carboligase